MTRTPFPPLFLTALVSFASSLSFGCDSDDSSDVPPSGVTCSSVTRASSASDLTTAIGSASSGGCVVVSGSLTSTTALSIKSGITLVGAAGARASITVTDAAASAAITLADGAQLGNLDVLAAPRTGVLVDGSNAKIFDLKISGAKSAALAVVSAGSPGTVTISNTSLEKNAYGLYVRGAGANVVVSGGRVAENGGTSLSSGVGIAVSEGAKITLDGVTVEKNEGTGILLDGSATRAVIKGSTVSENRERGIWAQGLQGTLDAPALAIEDTQLLKNRIVGMGGVQLKGIIIVGGSVKETVASPVPTNLATNELIGDGVGIFGGSTDFKIERTNFERNDRAAGVVDGTEVGIIIVGGKVDPGDSGLRFVVQNSSADIQIDAANKSVPPKPLGISAPTIKLPATL